MEITCDNIEFDTVTKTISINGEVEYPQFTVTEFYEKLQEKIKSSDLEDYRSFVRSCLHLVMKEELITGETYMKYSKLIDSEDRESIKLVYNILMKKFNIQVKYEGLTAILSLPCNIVPHDKPIKVTA